MARQGKALGDHIRLNVIPAGMSVKAAAGLLRIGRPALSNLLNGNAALSGKMALRLEKTFGTDAAELLGIQSKMQHKQHVAEGKALGVRTYVPTFVGVKSLDLSSWAGTNINARHELPVLIRRLVHSTGRGLREVDFPGFDNAEQPGWDGRVEAREAAAWIPEGKSGWEMGTSRDIKRKADGDFRHGLKLVPTHDREEWTFVFVTPHVWSRKHQWVQEREDECVWRAVRVIDGNDLEQWLEESVTGQLWLADRMGVATDGVRTLDRCWEDWAQASEPQLTEDLFEPAVAAHRQTITRWLSGRGERPLVVAADSVDEGVAFLACVGQDSAVPTALLHTAVVFDSRENLRRLAGATCPLIPVVHTEEAERELGSIFRERHCVVIRSRNDVREGEAEIILTPLRYESFETALKAMGILDRNEVDRQSRESGRSPTILRRRLSPVLGIQRPPWASDRETARRLVPMGLIGAWASDCIEDREVIRRLARRPYEDVEVDFAGLLGIDDCPVWRVGRHCGVVSKLDVFFGIANWMMEHDINEFLGVAKEVLSEIDPPLELDENARWTAVLHGKTRRNSTALRSGVCETLVLLAEYGNHVFHHFRSDLEAEVSALVAELLTPFTEEVLLSQVDDLPLYAEAAPEFLLELLEGDLQSENPVVHCLFVPSSTDVFGGGCLRSGLLSALECLAWNRNYLPRVALILAILSERVIHDNWTNKPINSLTAIFLHWCPRPRPV